MPFNFRISLFQSAKDNSPQAVSIEWPKLLEELGAYEIRATKDGLAWSPASFEGSRSAANAREVSLAVFDLDDCPDEALGNLGVRLDDFTYALHSTFTPGCYRLVIPLASPVPATDWPATWDQIRTALDIPADPACKDAARLYYWPACPDGQAKVVCENAGVSLSPASLARVPRPEPISEPIKAPASEEPAVDLFHVRKQLRSVRKPASAKLIHHILDGKPFDFPEGRDASMNRAASLIATTCHPAIPWSVALEILRPSLNATPQEKPGHFEHWVKELEDMYTRAIKRREAGDAKQAELAGAMEKLLGKKLGPDDESEAWRKTLLAMQDKEGAWKLQNVSTNASIILKHDPAWAGMIRHNVVTKKIELHEDAPIHEANMNDPAVAIKNWLAISDYHLVLKSYEVGEEVLNVALQNRFDPLADMLNGLQWDGVERLGSFFPRYFGSTGNARYLKRAGECWLISAVARALRPGCQVDTVLMLKGKQGTGKSSALRILGGDFFTDTQFSIHDKDGRLLAAQSWIIELGELAGTSRAELEGLKAFFTACSDTIRAPYARVHEEYKRRCVFVGTTNNDEYLAMDDEQRRYLPINVGKVDLEALKRDRGQILAEAVHRFKEGEAWWMSEEDKPAAEEAAQAVSKESVHAEPILLWWMQLRKKPEAVTAMEVAMGIGYSTDKINQSLKTAIAKCLKGFGFLSKVKRIGPAVVNSWCAPKDFMEATKEAFGQILSLPVTKGAEA